MRKRIYVGLAVILVLMSFRHPMHVSVTEIEIDAEDKALKLITHVFMDDIEAIFRVEKGNNELDITEKAVKPDFKIFLKGYLTKHLQLSINEKPVEVSYLGYEEEGDGIWCYLEVLKVKNVKTLKVKNTLLIETFEDQTNLVHVEYGKKVKSAKLDAKSVSYLFEIEK